ncbi:elongation factor P--(R)-beta-lysine ligase [Thalassotalea profundi]|uniref:Elongation factor P--(R)-beta-lysine ligase n=1 Tax=Thalassotalea profundi TaxID=2036687 RepID=A0ABQ3IU63_9GAMM|nr:elongation factor P--(R)-beta-lysine ligase [Thalassotalea profundi]GHE94185.1 elongation factor P--(R)-beta-lysine ligase [Thalassotalea profundi]
MSTSKLTWELAKERASNIRKIRQFFYDRDVVEVETPLLSNGTVTDVHLDAFESKYEYFPHSSIKSKDTLFLQTSPEFAMKRLIAGGYGSIFQICKAFRREPFGRFHNPEFTMLEWYCLGYSEQDLIDQVADLLVCVLNCDFPEKKSYQQVFNKATGINPLETSISELKEFLCKQQINDVWIKEEREKDILLQYIFSNFVETSIGKEVPCFIYDFPSSQAALARISQDDPRVAQRFECYYQGIELANGYNELIDPQEQINRFNRDNDFRKRLGKEQLPIDNNFIEAISLGLPQCSGVALGLDRLMMLALDKTSIDEVITFNIETA